MEIDHIDSIVDVDEHGNPRFICSVKPDYRDQWGRSMELKSITFHEGEEIYWNPEKQQYEGIYAGVYCCFKPDMVGHDGGIKITVQIGDDYEESLHFYGDGTLKIRGLVREQVPFIPMGIQPLFWAAVNKSHNGEEMAKIIRNKFNIADAKPFLQTEEFDISEGLTGPNGEKIAWEDI